MKYCVLRINNKQYRVSDGEEILVETSDQAKTIEADVLLFVDEDKVTIGTPTLAKPKVKLTLLGEEKGDKIHVRKYKAKSRYRKHIGSRAHYNRYSIHIIL